MLVNKVSSVDELFIALDHIGMWKNHLPVKLRDWVNVLGLHVQRGLLFPGTDAQDYLSAGGKFRKYFYATCDYDLSDEKHTEIMASAITGDFNHWKVKKLDQEVWEKRFAHLVEPTCEIAFYLSDDKGQSLPKLMDVVNHFKSTGEWLGLYDNKCISCGQSVLWWDYFCCKPCPHCEGKIRD